MFSNGDNKFCAGSRYCSAMWLPWALLRHDVIISIFWINNLVSTKCMATNNRVHQGITCQKHYFKYHKKPFYFLIQAMHYAASAVDTLYTHSLFDMVGLAFIKISMCLTVCHLW